MHKLIILTIWVLLAGLINQSVLAQTPVSSQDTLIMKKIDSTTHMPSSQRGKFHGHAKSYWMGTDNKQGLSDAYAWGVGAGIGYETPMIANHFTFGLSGFFIFNVLSSDLSLPDPTTGQANRYEIGLFNLQNPKDREDLDRLEELYLQYHFGRKSTITLGRQIPHSPFINPQDGRMRPTLTEGLVVKWRELPNTTIQAEYLSRISPRSTVKWFSVGESIGLYPVGVDTTGNRSQYAGHTETKGIVQLGVTRKIRRINLQLWDTYVHNVFNTAYIKAELNNETTRNHEWYGGIQLGKQRALGQGGNPEPDKSYYSNGGKSLFISGRIGYRTPQWAMDFNATRITAQGRYLMPREWGRDPFYTFLPRERNEGLGDVSAGSINLHYMPSPQWKWEFGSGVYHLPDPSDSRLNKYGMPGYIQLNLGMRHTFKGILEGLDAQMLVVRKDPLNGSQLKNDRYIFNKVNMTHFDFILNYHF
jgi:hypothetical protein